MKGERRTYSLPTLLEDFDDSTPALQEMETGYHGPLTEAPAWFLGLRSVCRRSTLRIILIIVAISLGVHSGLSTVTSTAVSNSDIKFKYHLVWR